MLGGGLQLNVAKLQIFKTPVQESIEPEQTEENEGWVKELPASTLGLGHSAPENLALRQKLARPGPPFGGLGFFDPKQAFDGDLPGVTAERIRKTKLKEFVRCAKGEPSVYFWGLQPIFDARDVAVGAEILVRARNGSDSAPFEDVQAILDPAAPSDVRDAYTMWKATEIVDWPLKTFKKNPILQNLQFVSANLRPLDLNTGSPIFKEVAERLRALSDKERKLLLSMVSIEVTEDQEHPDDIETSLQAWRHELGFRCVYDDTIGELACTALGKHSSNFHTTSVLNSILANFWLVKVDIEWAGYMLFLCHPCLSSRANQKAEVLDHARDEDLVYVPQGPVLKNTMVKHSEALAEFATWALHMIESGKHICIELTVRQEDENCALAITRLRDLGLDIFDKHAANFCFQGGLCGAKAFEPEVLAESAKLE